MTVENTKFMAQYSRPFISIYVTLPEQILNAILLLLLLLLSGSHRLGRPQGTEGRPEQRGL